MNIRSIFQVTTAMLCGLSFVLMPAKGIAVDYCCQQDECCDEGWGRTALLVGGAIVAGGIAGAIAGHSNHKHHHHSGGSGGTGNSGASGATGVTGATGATGATGTDTFIPDDCAVLTFNIPDFDTAPAFTTSAPDGAVAYEVFAFVSTPDGRVITVPGTATGTAAGGVVALNLTVPLSVPVTDIVLGTYHVGLHLVNDGTLLTQTIPGTFNPTVSVFSPACSGTTTEVVLETVIFGQALASLAGGDDVQAETEFTYDPDFFVP